MKALVPSLVAGISKKDVAVKKPVETKRSKPSAGNRIIASLKEAVDRAEGKEITVRVSTVEAPVIDVKATRRPHHLKQNPRP